jgi:signal peptidase I
VLTKLLAFFPIFKYKISGQSMLPTLQPGQNVLVNKLSRITTQDIVAAKDPRDGKILIKRVEKITDGNFYVLGKVVFPNYKLKASNSK